MSRIMSRGTETPPLYHSLKASYLHFRTTAAITQDLVVNNDYRMLLGTNLLLFIPASSIPTPVPPLSPLNA